jgi:flagellar biosynthesis protein FlhG
MPVKTKTISITSGKGGVGKTTMTANLAMCLALKGKRVLILDGDLGMANIDLVFGIKADRNISSLFNGEIGSEKSIQDLILPVMPNISLLSGGSGLVELNRLSQAHRQGIMDSIGELEYQYDYLLIDTAPGISDNVLYFNAAAQVSMVVITPDPTSLADSYALIKTLNKEYRETRFAIVCNQVRDEAEGMMLFQKFSDVVAKFLYISLDFVGSQSSDNLIRKSLQNQRLIMKHEPQSLAAEGFRKIQRKLEESLAESKDKSGLQFFWGQVVGVA